MTHRFVHLRLHSEYSITDGAVRIDEAVARAAGDDMPALAITDLGNVFGMVKFYKAARGSGIKPIIGCDVWIENESDRDKGHRLLLLVQSHQGYRRLCELLSRAWLENQHRGHAEIKRAWLAHRAPVGAQGGGTDGLIALSGASASDIGGALAQDNVALAERLARDWSKRFPGRFYIEVQRTGAPQTERIVRAAVGLAARLGLPVVATHPVQFISAEEFAAHEARVCIAQGYVLGDQRRPRLFAPQSYFTSQAEMAELFADLPEALANSVEIAKRCSLELELGKNKLPQFPAPKGTSLEDYLRSQSRAGLKRRLAALFEGEGARREAEARYGERLEFELKTIVQMGFAGYFLIVADFINWAKANGVPVGPGRGSGAGSLAAYALGITDLDPLRYDLLFERFLNPERVSMPDFDIDFCQEGRDRVIDYVKQKYGRDCVSQIATFGTMAAKAVVRDVGRVLEWPYGRTDELAKLIPFQPGKTVTLKHRVDASDRETVYAREVEPQIGKLEESDEETRQLLELAMQLEGLVRNVGMHAGGVLIAPGKLTDFCPLYAAEGSHNAVSQLDKDDVEAIGLVKFDFLGLTTLTILDWTARHVRRLVEPDFSFDAIPMDDPESYRVFAGANTAAVFQFESRGMRDLLKRARPDCFEDIIALVALYRPGPMDLIPDFVDRKHGRQAVTYPDERLQPILGPTYGVMVYQEQVMQIAQVIGGYSLGSADLLRRAMGKKKVEEMAQQRDNFVTGAQNNGVDRNTANELFDLMEKFAGYGFNKSHAAAYALVAYQTAYAKAHYAAAFMAANLSAVMDDTDKVHALYADARANRITLLPPDINASEFRFFPVDAKTIRYGLGAVKGTGESAIAAIQRARAEGPFRDLFDFAARIDKRIVNRRVIEALVRSGAFDSIDDDRANLLASVGIAIEAAEQAERNAQQASLFGGAEPAHEQRVARLQRPRWSETERLQAEKAVLGFYYSGHPFNAYSDEVGKFVRGGLRNLVPSGEGDYAGRSQLVAGVVEAVRTQRMQSGRMVLIIIGDGVARQEVSVYPEVFEKYRGIVREDSVLVMEVKVRLQRRAGQGDEDGDTATLRVHAEKIYSLTEARNRFARSIKLSMNGEISSAAAVGAQKLKDLLAPYCNGTCPVAVRYQNATASVEMRLGEGWRVSLDDRLLASLHEWLNPENVEVLYS